MSVKKGIQFIEKKGLLLVFPINNKREPDSLWYNLHPRSKMRWEWDVDGDDRVVQLWYLREKLSTSGKVVYTKWYQNRATFFSPDAFVHFLAVQQAHKRRNAIENPEARAIIDILEMDSPLSTKQIKEAVELQGKSLEAHYNRAMKELWQSGLIVAFGEVQDSSFPSLAVGATKNLFEKLWTKSKDLDPKKSLKWLETRLGAESLFFKYLKKNSLRPILESDDDRLLIASEADDTYDPRYRL